MNPLIDDDDDQKKAMGPLRLTERQQSTLYYTKIALGIVSFLSGVVGIILTLGWPETWTILLSTTSDYRNAAGQAADGYPLMNATVIGTANVGLIAAFASLLASIGYAINVFFHAAEVEQLSRGTNPWFWVFSSIWTPTAFLAIQFVSGIHNVYIHVLLFLAVWGWLWIFWQDDLLHSNAYRMLSRQVRDNDPSDAAMWSWLSYVQGLVLALVVYVVIFIYLGFTFSAADAPSLALIAIPIVFGVIYLIAVPLILLLYRVDTISTLYTREMSLYILSFVGVLAVTWVTLGVLAAVTPLVVVP